MKKGFAMLLFAVTLLSLAGCSLLGSISSMEMAGFRSEDHEILPNYDFSYQSPQQDAQQNQWENSGTVQQGQTYVPVITDPIVPVNPNPNPGYTPNYDTSSTLEYWIAYCDVRYLSSSDLAGLTKEECRIARNAIYAKSGRMFKDDSLSSYFSAYSWYRPYISASNFSDDMLSDVQLHNLNVVIEYEKRW